MIVSLYLAITGLLCGINREICMWLNTVYTQHVRVGKLKNSHLQMIMATMVSTTMPKREITTMTMTIEPSRYNVTCQNASTWLPFH
jgi:hypothetical protein